MTTEVSKRVLVLGASGMLGNAVLRLFAVSPGFEVTGSARSLNALASLAPRFRQRVLAGIDVENHDSLVQLMTTVRPQVVINCIGLIKQLATADDPLAALPINALLPHRLSRLCALSGARLVHISTDCVFSGAKGMYTRGRPCRRHRPLRPQQVLRRGRLRARGYAAHVDHRTRTGQRAWPDRVVPGAVVGV